MGDLSFDDYQGRSATTALYPGQGSFIGLTYAIIGLNGEAGETGEQIKKIWRDDAADIEAVCQVSLDRLQAALTADAGRGTIDAAFTTARAEITDAFKVPITGERREKILKELGDTMWYMSQVATELGVDLSYVATQNLDKLAGRRAANKIHGEGSDR